MKFISPLCARRDVRARARVNVALLCTLRTFLKTGSRTRIVLVTGDELRESVRSAPAKANLYFNRTLRRLFTSDFGIDKLARSRCHYYVAFIYRRVLSGLQRLRKRVRAASRFYDPLSV